MMPERSFFRRVVQVWLVHYYNIGKKGDKEETWSKCIKFWLARKTTTLYGQSEFSIRPAVYWVLTRASARCPPCRGACSSCPDTFIWYGSPTPPPVSRICYRRHLCRRKCIWTTKIVKTLAQLRSGKFKRQCTLCTYSELRMSLQYKTR